MRKPTPPDELFAWHAAALAGDEPAITDEPQCGWYRTRLVRFGPWMPVWIGMDQPRDFTTGELTGPEEPVCVVGIETKDAGETWPWCCQEPIDRFEYHRMLQNLPAEPYRAIDFNVIKPEF